MTDGELRVVSEDGSVPIPADIRERIGIDPGDKVVVRASGQRILIETGASRDAPAEGYRAKAERAREMAEEFAGISHEAEDSPGDAPDW